MSLIEIDWNPSRSKLRQFALIWLCGFALFGLVIAWRIDCFSGSQNWRLPFLIWTSSALVGLPGLLWPGAVRPVYKLWMALTFPLGWLLSHLVLAVIYYGFFATIGLIFRLIGRDPLNKRGKMEGESFWIRRSAGTSKERYFQQF